MSGSSRLEPFTALIADEVNVKQVVLSDDVAAVAGYDLQVVPAALGPRLGGNTQQVIKAVKTGDWSRSAGGVVAGGIELHDGEYTLRLVVAGDAASTPLSSVDGVVLLDTEVTPELAAEGTTRDLIRAVQQARRDAGLHVSDRIRLTLGLPESLRRQVVAFERLLVDAALVVDLVWSADGVEPNAELDGEAVHVSVTRSV